MTTQERPTFVVRSLVAIAYRFSQAPVSLIGQSRDEDGTS